MRHRQNVKNKTRTATPTRIFCTLHFETRKGGREGGEGEELSYLLLYCCNTRKMVWRMYNNKSYFKTVRPKYAVFHLGRWRRMRRRRRTTTATKDELVNYYYYYIWGMYRYLLLLVPANGFQWIYYEHIDSEVIQSCFWVQIKLSDHCSSSTSRSIRRLLRLIDRRNCQQGFIERKIGFPILAWLVQGKVETRSRSKATSIRD